MSSTNSSMAGHPSGSGGSVLSKGDVFINLITEELLASQRGGAVAGQVPDQRCGMSVLPADVPPLPTKYSSYRFRKLTDHHIPSSLVASAIAGTTGEGTAFSDFTKINTFLQHQLKHNPADIGGPRGGASTPAVSLGQLAPSSPHCAGWEQVGMLKGIFGGEGGSSGGGAQSSGSAANAIPPPGMRKKKGIRDKFVILNEIAEQCDVAMSICTQEAKYVLRTTALLPSLQDGADAPQQPSSKAGSSTSKMSSSVQSVAEHLPESHREALIFFNRHTHLCFLVYRLYVRHLCALQSTKASSSSTSGVARGAASQPPSTTPPESVSTFFASMKQAGGGPSDIQGVVGGAGKKGFTGALDLTSPQCASCAASPGDMFHLYAPIQDGTAAVNDMGTLLSIPKPIISTIANHNDQHRRRAEDSLGRPVTQLVDLLTNEGVVAVCRRAPSFVALTPLFYASGTSMQGLVSAASSSLDPTTSTLPTDQQSQQSVAAFGMTSARFSAFPLQAGGTGDGGKGREPSPGQSTTSTSNTLDFQTALQLIRILRLVTHSLAGDFERLMPLVTLDPLVLDGGASNTLEQLVTEAASKTAQSSDSNPRKSADFAPRAHQGAQLLLRYQLLQAVLWEIQSLCSSEGLDYTLRQQALALRLDVLSFRMAGASALTSINTASLSSPAWMDAYSGTLATNLLSTRNAKAMSTPSSQRRRWSSRVSPAHSVEGSLIRGLDWTYAVLSYPSQGTTLPPSLLKMLSQTNDGTTTTTEVSSHSSNSSFAEDPTNTTTATNATSPSPSQRRTLLRLSFSPACTIPLQALVQANLLFSLISDSSLASNVYASSATVIAPHALDTALTAVLGGTEGDASGLVKRLAKVLHLLHSSLEDGVFGYDYHSISNPRANGICVRPAVLVGEGGEGCVIPFELQTVSHHEYTHRCFLRIPGSPGCTYTGTSVSNPQDAPSSGNSGLTSMEGVLYGDTTTNTTTSSSTAPQSHFGVSSGVAMSSHPLSNYYHKRSNTTGGATSATTASSGALPQWLYSLSQQSALQSQYPLLVADGLGHADQQGGLVGRGPPCPLSSHASSEEGFPVYFPLTTAPFTLGSGARGGAVQTAGEGSLEDPFLLAELYHCGTCADADPYLHLSPLTTSKQQLYFLAQRPTGGLAVPTSLDLPARLPRHVASQLAFQQLLLAAIRAATHSAAIRHLVTLSPTAQSILFIGLSPSYFPAAVSTEVKSSPGISCTPPPASPSSSTWVLPPAKGLTQESLRGTEQKWASQAAIDSMLLVRQITHKKGQPQSITALVSLRWSSFLREHLSSTLYPQATNEACIAHEDRVSHAIHANLRSNESGPTSRLSAIVDGFRSAGPHPRLHDAVVSSIAFSLAFVYPTLNNHSSSSSSRSHGGRTSRHLMNGMSRDLRVSLLILSTTASHVGSESSIAHPLQGAPTFGPLHSGSGRSTPLTHGNNAMLLLDRHNTTPSRPEPFYSCIHPTLVPSQPSVSSLLWLLHQQRQEGTRASSTPTGDIASHQQLPPLTESEAHRAATYLWLETTLMHIFITTRVLEPLPLLSKAVPGLILAKSATSGTPTPQTPSHGPPSSTSPAPARCVDLTTSRLFRAMAPGDELLKDEEAIRKRIAHELGRANTSTISDMIQAGGGGGGGGGQGSNRGAKGSSPSEVASRLYGHSMAVGLPSLSGASTASIIRATRQLTNFINTVQRISDDTSTGSVLLEAMTGCEVTTQDTPSTPTSGGFMGGVRCVPLSDYLGVVVEGALLSLGTPGTLQRGAPSDDPINDKRLQLEEGLRVVDEFEEGAQDGADNACTYRNECEHLSFLNLMAQAVAWGFHGVEKAHTTYSELTQNSAALAVVAKQAKAASALDMRRRKQKKIARVQALLMSSSGESNHPLHTTPPLPDAPMPPFVDGNEGDDDIDPDEQLFNHLYPYLYSPYCSPVYAYYTTRSPEEDALNLSQLRSARNDQQQSPSGLNDEPSSSANTIPFVPLGPPPRALSSATPSTGLHRLVHGGILAQALAATSTIAPGGTHYDGLLQDNWENPSPRWTGVVPLKSQEESGAIIKMLQAAGDLAKMVCVANQDVAVEGGVDAEGSGSSEAISPDRRVPTGPQPPSTATPNLTNTFRHLLRLNRQVRDTLCGRAAPTKESEREEALAEVLLTALELRFASPPAPESNPNAATTSSPVGSSVSSLPSGGCIAAHASPEVGHATLAASLGEAVRDILHASTATGRSTSSSSSVHTPGATLSSVANFTAYVNSLVSPLGCDPTPESSLSLVARIRADAAPPQKGKDIGTQGAVRAEQMQRTSCGVGFLITALLGLDTECVDAILSLDGEGGLAPSADPTAATPSPVASSLHMLARGMLFSRAASLRAWKEDNNTLLRAATVGDVCSVMTEKTDAAQEQQKHFSGHPSLYASLMQTESMSALLGSIASSNVASSTEDTTTTTTLFSSRTRKAATQALGAVVGEVGELLRITSPIPSCGMSFTGNPHQIKGGGGLHRIPATFPSEVGTDSPLSSLVAPTLQHINSILWASTNGSPQPSDPAISATLQTYLISTPQGEERHLRGARSTHPLTLNGLTAPHEVPTVALGLYPNRQTNIPRSLLLSPSSPHTLFANSWGCNVLLGLLVLEQVSEAVPWLATTIASSVAPTETLTHIIVQSDDDDADDDNHVPPAAKVLDVSVVRAIRARFVGRLSKACRHSISRSNVHVPNVLLSEVIKRESQGVIKVAVELAKTPSSYTTVLKRLHAHLQDRFRRAVVVLHHHINHNACFTSLETPRSGPASQCDVVFPPREATTFPLSTLIGGRYICEAGRVLCRMCRSQKDPIVMQTTSLLSLLVPALMQVISSSVQLAPTQPDAFRFGAEAKGLLGEIVALAVTSSIPATNPLLAAAATLTDGAVTLPSELISALGSELHVGDASMIATGGAIQWASTEKQSTSSSTSSGGAELLARRFTACLHPLSSAPSLLSGRPTFVDALLEAQSALSGLFPDSSEDWRESAAHEVPSHLFEGVINTACITVLLASSTTSYTTRDLEDAYGYVVPPSQASVLSVTPEGGSCTILPASNAPSRPLSTTAAGSFAMTAGLLAVSSKRRVEYSRADLNALANGDVCAALHSPLYSHCILPTVEGVNSRASEPMAMPPLIDRHASSIFVGLQGKKASAFSALQWCARRLLINVVNSGDAASAQSMLRLLSVLEASLFAAGPEGARYPLPSHRHGGTASNPQANENFAVSDFPHATFAQLLHYILSSLLAAPVAIRSNPESPVYQLLFAATRTLFTVLSSVKTILPPRGPSSSSSLLEVYLPSIEVISSGIPDLMRPFSSTTNTPTSVAHDYYRFVVSGLSGLLMYFLHDSNWGSSSSSFPALQYALQRFARSTSDDRHQQGSTGAAQSDDDTPDVKSPSAQDVLATGDGGMGRTQSGLVAVASSIVRTLTPSALHRTLSKDNNNTPPPKTTIPKVSGTRQGTDALDAVAERLTGNHTARAPPPTPTHPHLAMVNSIATMLGVLQELTQTVRHLWLPLYSDSRGSLTSTSSSSTPILRQVLLDVSHLLVNGRTSHDYLVSHPSLHHTTLLSVAAKVTPRHAATPELLPVYTYVVVRTSVEGLVDTDASVSTTTSWRNAHDTSCLYQQLVSGSQDKSKIQHEDNPLGGIEQTAQFRFASTVGTVRSSLIAKLTVAVGAMSPRQRAPSSGGGSSTAEGALEKMVPVVVSSLVGAAATVCERLCPAVLPVDAPVPSPTDDATTTTSPSPSRGATACSTVDSWLYVGVPKAPHTLAQLRSAEEETRLIKAYLGPTDSETPSPSGKDSGNSATKSESKNDGFQVAFVDVLRRVCQEAFMLAASGAPMPPKLPSLPPATSLGTLPEDIPADELKAVMMNDVAIKQFLWPSSTGTTTTSPEATLSLLREVEQVLVELWEESKANRSNNGSNSRGSTSMTPATLALWNALYARGGVVDPGHLLDIPDHLTPAILMQQLQSACIVPTDEVLHNEMSAELKHRDAFTKLMDMIPSSPWQDGAREATRQGLDIKLPSTRLSSSPDATTPCVLLHITSDPSSCQWYDTMSRCMVMVKRLVGQPTPIRIIITPMLGVPCLDAPWASKFRPNHLVSFHPTNKLSPDVYTVLDQLKGAVSAYVHRLSDVQANSSTGTSDALSNLSGIAASQLLKSARVDALSEMGGIVRQVLLVAAEHQWSNDVVPAVREAMKSAAGVHADINNLNSSDLALYNSVLSSFGEAPSTTVASQDWATPLGILSRCMEPMSALLFSCDTTSKSSDRSSGTAGRLTSLDASPGGLMDCSTSVPGSNDNTRVSGHKSVEPPGGFLVPHELRKDTKKQMLAGGGGTANVTSSGAKGGSTVGLNVAVKDESRLWHDHIHVCVGSVTEGMPAAGHSNDTVPPARGSMSLPTLSLPLGSTEPLRASLISVVVQSVCSIVSEVFVRKATAFDARCDDVEQYGSSLLSLNASRNPFVSTSYTLRRMVPTDDSTTTTAAPSFNLEVHQGSTTRSLFARPSASALTSPPCDASPTIPTPTCHPPATSCNMTLDDILSDFDCGAIVACDRVEDERDHIGIRSVQHLLQPPVVVAPLSFEKVHAGERRRHKEIVSSTILNGLIADRKAQIGRQRTMSEVSVGDGEGNTPDVDHAILVGLIGGGVDNKNMFRSRRAGSSMPSTGAHSEAVSDVDTPAITIDEVATSNPSGQASDCGGDANLNSEHVSGTTTPSTTRRTKRGNTVFTRRSPTVANKSDDTIASDEVKSGIEPADCGQSLFCHQRNEEVPSRADSSDSGGIMPLSTSIAILLTTAEATVQEGEPERNGKQRGAAIDQYNTEVAARRQQLLTLEKDAAPWVEGPQEGTNPFHDPFAAKMSYVPQLLWSLLPAVYAPAALFSTPTTLATSGDPEGVAGVSSPNHGVDASVLGVSERQLLDTIVRILSLESTSTTPSVTSASSRALLPFTLPVSTVNRGSFSSLPVWGSSCGRPSIDTIQSQLGAMGTRSVAVVNPMMASPNAVYYRTPIGPIVHSALHIQVSMPIVHTANSSHRPLLSTAHADATTTTNTATTLMATPHPTGMVRQRSRQLLANPKAESERQRRVQVDVAARLAKRQTKVMGLVMQCGLRSTLSQPSTVALKHQHNSSSNITITTRILSVKSSDGQTAKFAGQIEAAVRATRCTGCSPGSSLCVVVAASRRDGLEALLHLPPPSHTSNSSTHRWDGADAETSTPSLVVFTIVYPSEGGTIGVLTIPSWLLVAVSRDGGEVGGPSYTYSKEAQTSWIANTLLRLTSFVGNGVSGAFYDGVTTSMFIPALSLLQASAPSAPTPPTTIPINDGEPIASLLVDPPIPSLSRAIYNEVSTTILLH